MIFHSVFVSKRNISINSSIFCYWVWAFICIWETSISTGILALNSWNSAYQRTYRVLSRCLGRIESGHWIIFFESLITFLLNSVSHIWISKTIIFVSYTEIVKVISTWGFKVFVQRWGDISIVDFRIFYLQAIT